MKKITDPVMIQQLNDNVHKLWNVIRDRVDFQLNGGPYKKQFEAIHNFFKDNYGFTFFDDFDTVASKVEYKIGGWREGYLWVNFTLGGQRFEIKYATHEIKDFLSGSFRMKRKSNPHICLSGWYMSSGNNFTGIDVAFHHLYTNLKYVVREYDFLTKIYNALQ